MQKENNHFLLKEIVIQFRTLFSRFEKNTGKAFAVLVLFGFINFILLVSSPQDFFMDKSDLDYEVPSVLYGKNKSGKFEPIAEYYKFSRVVITLDKDASAKPSILEQSFLSTEDNSFYSHPGIDFLGILRAIYVNFSSGRIREGASTITQQVARLKFLSNERSFARKLREVWLSLFLEFKFSKKQILETYLNEIPLGHGTLGVGAASRFYFRKEASELNYGESALLASLTTRPTQFSPLVNPNSSLSKVKVVMKKLVENGRLSPKKASKEFDELVQNFYATLNRSPNDSAYSDRLNRFPYVKEYIRKNLVKYVEPEVLYSGGLKIYSTIEIEHQEAAERVLKQALREQTKESNQRAFRNPEVFQEIHGPFLSMVMDLNDVADFRVRIPKNLKEFQREWQEYYRDELSTLNLFIGEENFGDALEENYKSLKTEDYLLPVEGSILSLRPFTGYITALVGGSEFRSDNQQIRTFQSKRQPGSSFKPLVYSAGMEYTATHNTKVKITPASQYLDSPLEYLLTDGEEWAPENYSSEYSGFVLLRRALELSRNSVAVRLVEDVGISNITPILRKLLQLNTRDIPNNYSVTLGSFEVSPFELTRAYAVFASNGRKVTPISLLRIENSKGEILQDFEKEHSVSNEQIVSPETSFLITSMMESVIKSGTGKTVGEYVYRPVAGKTGTTNNFRDAWFVGYTPELVTSVWIGYDTGTISLGKGMTGGKVSTAIWGKYVGRALANEPKKSFAWPELKIVKRNVCSFSGKLPGSKCQETYEEFFTKGTEPKAVCDDHKFANYGGGLESLSSDGDKKPNETKPKKKKKKKNVFQGDENIDF